ncbi:unnamed protein product [Closterium sp. NIES-65]|nr:unnamed protein product [Closterium sp. NIES-65]
MLALHRFHLANFAPLSKLCVHSVLFVSSSFGIVTLVMLSGRGATVTEMNPGSELDETEYNEPISISKWASTLVASGKTSLLRDPRMEAPGDIIERLARLAVSCTAMPTASRPSMSRVAQELEALRGEVGGGDVRASAAARVDEMLVGQQPVRSMEEDLALLEQHYAGQGKTTANVTSHQRSTGSSGKED